MLSENKNLDHIIQHFRQNVLIPYGSDKPKVVNYYRNSCSIKSIKKGDIFIHQGDTDYKAYYVYEGLFRVYTEQPSGAFINRTFIKEGQVYCDNTSYWQGIGHTVYAQALEDCILLTTPADELNKLCHEDIDFAQLLLADLKLFKVRHENREALLQSLSIEEYYKHIVKNFPELESRIPQYHVASYMGISEVSLSRIKKKILKES